VSKVDLNKHPEYVEHRENIIRKLKFQAQKDRAGLYKVPLAIIVDAMRDLNGGYPPHSLGGVPGVKRGSAAHRKFMAKDALYFLIHSKVCGEYCDWLGLNRGWVRRLALDIIKSEHYPMPDYLPDIKMIAGNYWK